MYKANGNAEGPYIHLGFKPRMILFKGDSTSESVTMWDSTSSTGKRWGNRIKMDNQTISSQNHIIPMSDGFRVISAGGETNSNTNVGYIAFAEDMSRYSTSFWTPYT
jgi:hypothetical protein